MSAIVTSGLSKQYRSHFFKSAAMSLDHLDLEIEENEVFGFLGQNGAGKTTTIKILCSLLRPSAGEARVFGSSVRDQKTRRHIGYLPENPYFYEYLTPRESIDFYGRLQGLDAPSREKTWRDLAERLDLGSIADQRVRGFSKGMRQRLGFAVAMVGDPDLLILDEPMSGLDPIGRRRIRELMLQLRDEGKTLFFSSHVLGDVEQICDRVGILINGKLATQGRIDELLAQRMHSVEIIAKNISPELKTSLLATANRHHDSEAGLHLHYPDEAVANAAARDILESGGRIVEFAAIRESLEDYFMQQQEVASK